MLFCAFVALRIRGGTSNRVLTNIVSIASFSE
jgi:hypothetical protein